MNYNNLPNKLLISLTLLILLSWNINAQNIPDGYYNKAEGLSNAALKTALSNIIEDIDEQSYGSGTWTAFEKSDKKDDGSVWDMYSYNVRYFPGDGDAPSGMNIEHSVAQSWFSESYSPKRDLHHLFPSDSNANSRRGNYPLGTTNTAASTNEAIKVGSNTYSSDFTGSVWEPLDEYKGDFARAYLYMFTCYEDLSWTSSSTYVINSGETWPMFKDWYKNLLLEWCRMDPPSEKEINRNDVIYSIQGNRNPYIDYPDLVEYLWGDLVGEAFTTDSTTPSITSPSSSSTYILPSVYYTETSTTDIEVKGNNLTESVSLTLSGEHADLFTLSQTTLSATEVTAGTTVTVTFYPEVAGTFEATLTISSSEITTNRTVTLQGVANENFMNLAATDVSGNSFTANWSKHSLATSYELNLYKKSVTEYQEIEVLKQTFESLPTGWSTDGYVTFSNDVARLASGSRDGSLISPNLDLSLPSTITVTAMQYSNDDSDLYVYIDNTLVATLTMGNNYTAYRVAAAAYTSSSTITLSANEDCRVYIANIGVVAGGTFEELVLEPNSPIDCSNNTSYTLTGLETSSIYAYEVIALWSGGSDTTTLTAVETTDGSTDIDKNEYTTALYVAGGNSAINLYNTPIGAQVAVYNTTGAQLLQHTCSTTTTQLSVSQQGIYIVQVCIDGTTTTYKVVVK